MNCFDTTQLHTDLCLSVVESKPTSATLNLTSLLKLRGRARQAAQGLGRERGRVHRDPFLFPYKDPDEQFEAQRPETQLALRLKPLRVLRYFQRSLSSPSGPAKEVNHSESCRVLKTRISYAKLRMPGMCG